MHLVKILFPIILLLTACQSTLDRRLEAAYELAGDNRAELERVVAHYDSLGEPDRLYAAKWLLANSISNKSPHGKLIDSLYSRLDSAYAANDSDWWSMRLVYNNLIKKADWSRVQYKKDLQYLKADYLISNIDKAFEVRNTPWSRNLTLDEFCEYILPYKIDNEPVEYWRDDYRSHFSAITDTVDMSADTAVYLLCRGMSLRYVSRNYDYPAGVPAFKPSQLKRTIVGPCSDYSNLLVFFGRTFGFPVVRDFVPHWANYPHTHSWSAVLLNGKTISYMPGEKNLLGDPHTRRFSNVMTKTFRKTTSPQLSSLRAKANSTDLPPVFLSPNLLDVTDQYQEVVDIPVKNLYKVDFKPDYVYLCVFDNKYWTAVDWTPVSFFGSSATFRKVAKRRAMYMPMYYHHGNYYPAQEPFLLDEEGDITYVDAQESETETVNLSRKYLPNRALVFLLHIKGGHLQLANKPDFSDVLDYVIPDTVGFCYQTWNVGGGKYRYFRFFPKKGRFDGNIAEVEFFAPDGTEIKGTPITNSADTLHGPKSMLDKNLLSFSVCADSTIWVGADLGKPQPIGRVDYLPRTDDNFIRDGEEYELFYWRNGWNSLGRQTGSRKTQALVYDNVPKDALLLLRNHSKGSEERIFMYADGKQVFY